MCFTENSTFVCSSRRSDSLIWMRDLRKGGSADHFVFVFMLSQFHGADFLRAWIRREYYWICYSTLPWSFISKPYSWYLSKTSLMLKQSRMVWGKRRKNETHLFNFFSYTFSGMFKPHVLPKELACMKDWTGSQMNCQSDLSTQKHRVFIL